MSQRIGAFICGCGGNISDYVDIEKVRSSVADEANVIISSTAMFTCSDATQQDIIDTIKEHELDGIVVASCSPKLHLETFRAMARRAGLNTYVYNQVNIREQCSWTHTHDVAGATAKAISLVRAGIARTREGAPLDDIRIDTTPRVLIIGAGVAGLRAAVGMADLGMEVHLVERNEVVGGQIARWGGLFPGDATGQDLIRDLEERVNGRSNIHLHLGAEVVKKTGNVGDFSITIKACDSSFKVNVGAIIVSTGYDRYQPEDGEYGYGQPGIVTLDRFRDMIDEAGGDEISYAGKPVRQVAFIYCVGSRQRDCDDCNTYCSRYCCTGAVHTALMAADLENPPHQYHLYRDMRTYGKYELLFDEALRRGVLFMKFDDDDPPTVTLEGDTLEVRVVDQLTGGEEIAVNPDLVVLVTGMVARKNHDLVDVLKLPVGMDGFFNEIHPKLRPVETVLDGVLIAGASQGPKNIPESVSSSMSAVAKSAALLMKGYIDLEPFVARVDPNLCTWCGMCAEECPYDAIAEVQEDGHNIATVNTTICKGCGVCVAACEPKALEVEGYTHRQVTSMIDALIKEAS